MSELQVIQGGKTKGFADAFARARLKFPVIKKDKIAKVRSERTGASYEYSYADLAQILDKIVPVLAEEGIAFNQPIVYREGKPYVATVLSYTDPSNGQTSVGMKSEGLPLPSQVEPQKLGVHLTFYRRYDACALLGVSAEEDTSNIIEPRRKSGRASGEGAATDGPGMDVPSTSPAQPELSPLERKRYLEDLAPYKEIVGSEPLKKFVLKQTKAKDIKSVTANGWEDVLAAVRGAMVAGGDQSVVALVNAD